MGKPKTKVLVASTDPNFLGENMSSMRTEFDLEVATTVDVASFLIKEWEPQITLIDGDSLMINSLAHVRFMVPLGQMGIIVVSATNNPQKEERAFREGTDYFLPMRISFRSLQLRIESLIRRLARSPHIGKISTSISSYEPMPSQWKEESLYIDFMDIRIFPNDFLVKRQSTIVNTTPTQFKLLLAFITQPEHLLSRGWLKEHVWENADISHRSIDAQISKLKRQIPELSQHLVNIYGKGYMLTKPQKMVA